MPVNLGSAVSAGGWAVFWIQLPVTALVIAVIIVGLAAIRRARPEDIPTVFAAFTTAIAAALGRRPTLPADPCRLEGTSNSSTPASSTEESA